VHSTGVVDVATCTPRAAGGGAGRVGAARVSRAPRGGSGPLPRSPRRGRGRGREPSSLLAAHAMLALPRGAARKYKLLKLMLSIYDRGGCEEKERGRRRLDEFTM
jgi:hypothetical protein